MVKSLHVDVVDRPVESRGDHEAPKLKIERIGITWRVHAFQESGKLRCFPTAGRIAEGKQIIKGHALNIRILSRSASCKR